MDHLDPNICPENRWKNDVLNELRKQTEEAQKQTQLLIKIYETQNQPQTRVKKGDSKHVTA